MTEKEEILFCLDVSHTSYLKIRNRFKLPLGDYWTLYRYDKKWVLRNILFDQLYWIDTLNHQFPPTVRNSESQYSVASGICHCREPFLLSCITLYFLLHAIPDLVFSLDCFSI